MGAWEAVGKAPLKFTFPCYDEQGAEAPTAEEIGNGEVIAADELSLKSRLVPVMVLLAEGGRRHGVGRQSLHRHNVAARKVRV